MLTSWPFESSTCCIQGRYPLHLHAVTDDAGVGDVSNCSLVGVSVHHSFNRGINVHGGTGARILNSTIYKNLGHAFFVEDGSETKNVFIGNLGALTLRAMSLLESDQTPSTFWITNGDNVFEDNIAAGGDAFGFWINLPRHPGGFLSFTGATFRDDIFPRHALLGSFTRNTAHGYRVGFLAHDLDPKEFHMQRQVKRKRDGWSRRWFKEVDETPGLRRTAVLSNLLAFSNNEAGAIVADLGHVQIRDFVAAPGAEGQPLGLATLQYKAEQWGDDSNGWNAPLISDSLFIGDGASRNACGLSGPMSSWLTVENTAFHNFASGSAAICACHLCNGGKGGVEVRTRGLRFSGIAQGARVKFAHHHFETIFHDLDGSLTGGVAGGWMHGASLDVDGGSLGHFPTTSCALTDTGSTRNAPRAIVCNADVKLRTFRWRHVQPQNTFSGRAAVVTTPHGSSLVPWQKYDILLRTSDHHFTAVSGLPHSIDWMANMAFPVDHQGWGAGELCELRAGEHFVLETTTLSNPHRWEFEGNEVEYPALHGGLSGLAPLHRLNGFWQYTPVSTPLGNGSNGEVASTPGKLQMLVSSQKASLPSNLVEENVQGVGGWGGTCTCPDGEVLYAGDNYNSCWSLACINGISGSCERRSSSEWAHKRVTCAQPIYPFGSDATPSCSESPEDCHKGQRCVSATLARHECPPVGCFVDANHCLGDQRVSAQDGANNASASWDWCTASDGWVIPGPEANVTIPAGAIVTLAAGCTTAVVQKLDVFGTLRFADDGSNSMLRARYIHVAADTGRLEAGTLDSPFASATATIQLHGNRLTMPYPNSGLGAKFLAVFGELSLVGAPRPSTPDNNRWWTQLVGRAESGETEIHLPRDWVSAVGLTIGDELVVAPSGLQWNESETVVVAGLNDVNLTYPDSTVVLLTSPVQYDHRGLSNTTWLGVHDHPFLAAEVALLRAGDGRFGNVVVEGVYDDGTADLAAEEFGARVAVLQKTDRCPSLTGIPAEAAANISGVEFRGCGQRGWETRGCVYVGPQQQEGRARYEWHTNGAVQIRDSTFIDGFNAGIQLDRVHGAIVEGNVLSGVQDYGIKVEGQRNRVVSNLVIGVADSFDKVNAHRGAQMPWERRWQAGTQHVFGLHHTGRGGVLRGNVVAGSEGMGALTDGHECGAEVTIRSGSNRALTSCCSIPLAWHLSCLVC